MFRFRIVNLGGGTVSATALCFASMTRVLMPAEISGADFSRRLGNHHRLAAPDGHRIAPGEAWDIEIRTLTHPPANRSQGAMSAWLETPEGDVPLLIGDLEALASAPVDPVRPAFEGQIEIPLSMLPWPQKAKVEEWGAQPGIRLRPDLVEIAALHRRLFPLAPSIISSAGRPVDPQDDPKLPEGGYVLDFAPEAIALCHHGPAGLRHGLIALAQIIHGALTDPRFDVPLRGRIEDWPRFAWRGMHMDVSRNFRPIEQVHRVIDILAWHRMNRLHWHLTDDEGWRLEIPALPQLTEIGSRRGMSEALAPQYADPATGQLGYYTGIEARALVAHGARLGIEVMPEIDMPGHLASLLAAMPELADRAELPDSYHSIQGYPNNAVNPAIPAVYDVLETVLDEVCDIFPSSLIHLGGDEVAPLSWQASPAAMRLAQAEGFGGKDVTDRLQAYFMRRMQDMLARRGRFLAGWDECADGGGVSAVGTLLFAWRSVEKTAELMEAGYDVVATPGQAYYLDMAHDHRWDGIGLTWGGVVPTEKTYGFEPSEGLPANAKGRLVGIQGGVWAEMLNSRARWNAMVFPRLSAVAESAWTLPEGKDFRRFMALAPLMPQL
ncbi:beta-N-acetylhexosaminidase [Paracoccus sp. MBLB3053]|uniref:beta-N-acetylhexosaminidase n=1 Tax=Paracoccus aurantius TaxID=3073814 RepID=A0ABU2HVP3_9RHOB|nr:beta-N-acetylhexosaminidase [Paracoccus sp. MBLB3053]MDS9469118.1 beta-N-acetylhexosaminidase [Paracoccus sp. MBLB3053]